MESETDNSKIPANGHQFANVNGKVGSNTKNS